MESYHLGMSRLPAERRLHATERRLERDPALKDQYQRFMKEFEELGHKEPIKSQEGRNTCYYLPHHPVFKETSSTTNIRVVFDGNAKTSNGVINCKSDPTLRCKQTPLRVQNVRC
jgi:hypothetical protein